MLPVPRIELPARDRKAAREVGDVLECGDGAERIRRFPSAWEGGPFERPSVRHSKAVEG
jgi:hypothetical protein